MDNVLYNYLAQPGDKEKGVVLIVDKPGVCDAFTLKYLYAATSENESDMLKKWAMEHDGDPRYFYGKRSPAYATDPRCQNYDLGNDPIASLNAQIAHVKYVVKNSPAWFHDNNIPNDYRELFPDFVIIELINCHLYLLISEGFISMKPTKKAMYLHINRYRQICKRKSYKRYSVPSMI